MCLSYVSLWNLEKATPVQKQPLVVLDEHAALDASCSSSCDVDAFGLRVSSSMQAGIFEKEGPKELEDAGKAGLVTIQGQFSIVLGTILVCKISSHNLSSFIGDHEFYFSIYSFAVVLWLISTNLNKQNKQNLKLDFQIEELPLILAMVVVGCLKWHICFCNSFLIKRSRYFSPINEWN
jgi:uncharacterized protein with PQ loop repeat